MSTIVKIFIFSDKVYHDSNIESFTSALYLNGTVGLRMSSPIWHNIAKKLRHEFTIDIWIEPDGGQADSATIIGWLIN